MQYQYFSSSLEHNRLNVEELLVRRNQLQPASVGGGGGEGQSLNGTKKFNSGLQITTLEINI